MIGRADWPRYDFCNKRVGVIGNGSSAIQIVPSLQPLDGINMTVFMRSRTWISGAFGDAAMLALGLDPNDINCKSRLGLAVLVLLRADAKPKLHLRRGRRSLLTLKHISR